jgi:bacillithiol biosynthesis deacetylase BshB1
MANILVVGPHPDDQELGMGATIARLADQGHDLLLLDMTNGEPTPFGSVETRALEAEAAAKILSPDSEPGSKRVRHPVRRLLLGLPNRRVEHTVENRHKVAGVIRAHQAQVVFAPYFEDAHPDHLAVTRIVEDARFDAKLTKVDMPNPPGFAQIGPPVYPKWLFYYYATHLRIVPQPSFLIDATGYLDRKIDAIRAYRSQFETNPANRGIADWVRAQAVYFGSRIGTAAAEPFFAREPIGLGGLEGVV